MPAAACAALLLSLAAAAPGTSSTIRWDNGKVTRIRRAGPLSLTATIKRAADAFGRPTRKRLSAPNVLGASARDRFPIVRANVRSGKIFALVLWIGAAGE